MKVENRFYVYMYLREKDSKTAKAGTPYYVGKGSGNRAYQYKPGGRIPPKNKDRIVFPYKGIIESDALEKERELIALYGRKDKTTGILINRTDGGDGASGAIVSDETRRKISKVHRNKTVSDKTRRKMSESAKTKPPASEETRKKISEASRNRSPETRKKISEAALGRIASDETRRKIGEASRNRSPETRKKLSEAFRGRIVSDETRNKISEARKRKISVNGIVYDTVRDAIKSLRISGTNFNKKKASGKIKVEYL